MHKILLTSEELQRELEITSYDVYQYLRRGLPRAQANLMMYDLDEAREWINGFGAREEKREAIKRELLNQLTDEEARIVSEPKWDAKYAVVWGMTSRRKALTIQRAIYLMVQYSTSRADNMVYLSRTTQQAKEVNTVVDRELGELGQGFISLTIQELATEILNNEQITFKTEVDAVRKAVQLLENKPKLQEKYGLIYRQLFVEELEKFTADERRLFLLLANYYGEYMVNVSQEAVEEEKEISEWLNEIGAGDYFISQ